MASAYGSRVGWTPARRKNNNNVINVTLFAYDEITLKTQNIISKRRQDIGKNVWESKTYGVVRLIKEFPNMKWSKRGVGDFLKRLRTTGSIERAPGSGRPCMTCRLLVCVDAEGRHFEHYL